MAEIVGGREPPGFRLSVAPQPLSHHLLWFVSSTFPRGPCAVALVPSLWATEKLWDLEQWGLVELRLHAFERNTGTLSFLSFHLLARMRCNRPLLPHAPTTISNKGKCSCSEPMRSNTPLLLSWLSQAFITATKKLTNIPCPTISFFWSFPTAAGVIYMGQQHTNVFGAYIYPGMFERQSTPCNGWESWVYNTHGMWQLVIVLGLEHKAADSQVWDPNH